MIKWNIFDTDSKNERAVFTPWIRFTGPFYSSRAHRPKVAFVSETPVLPSKLMTHVRNNLAASIVTSC